MTIEGYDPVVFWNAPSDGTYYLSAENLFADAFGDYEISAQALLDVHGDNPATATALSFPATISSAIDSLGDQDWFHFTAVAGDTFRFEVPKSDDSVELTLYDTDGTTQLDQVLFNPSIQWSAPSDGTYYLSINDVYDNDISGYELTAEHLVDDHGDDATTATLLLEPTTVTASIELAGDEDWFRFDAVAGEKFQFEIPTSDDYMSLTLYDSDGQTQLEQKTLFDVSIIWTAPSDGTYYLSVASYFASDVGDYELVSTQLIDDHGDDFEVATSIAVPAVISGSLEVEDDQDWFSFVAVAGEKFEFAVPVHDNDVELLLFDSDGSTQLERDIFSNPTFVWSAPSDGTYYITINGYIGSYTGNYEISASLIPDDHSDTPDTATPVALSQGSGGSVEIAEDKDWFRFDAVAGFAYDFELQWIGSGHGKLSLIDTDGSSVLESDRFSPNFSWNALTSGTYYLIAEGSSRNTVGDYLIRGTSAIRETEIAFTADAYRIPDQVTVSLIDATSFAAGSTVTISSSSGDSETLQITSTGIEFSTTLGTVEAVASPDDGTLQISSGDRLVVTYLDPDVGLGGKFYLETAVIHVDDHGDDQDGATIVEIPSTTSGSIQTTGDEDWFRFPAFAGREYTFATVLENLSGSRLSLYDADGTTRIDTHASFSGSEIEWVPQESGEYFLVVEGNNSSDLGTYQLTSSVSAPLFIEDVIVSSTQFSDNFINVIGGESGLGYSLVGDHQLESIPWFNIDTFYLQFNEDVSTTLSADDVLLTGSDGGLYNVDMVGYDRDTNVAEFRINDTVEIDSFVISIFDGAIANSFDVVLDGDWTTGQTERSGDGSAGGQFDFYFNVLAGDSDASGEVNSHDTFSIFASNTYASDLSNFRRDVDGSGQITVADVFIAAAHTTRGLQTAPTAPIDSSAATPAVASSGRELYSREKPQLADTVELAVGPIVGLSSPPESAVETSDGFIPNETIENDAEQNNSLSLGDDLQTTRGYSLANASAIVVAEPVVVPDNLLEPALWPDVEFSTHETIQNDPEHSNPLSLTSDLQKLQDPVLVSVHSSAEFTDDALRQPVSLQFIGPVLPYTSGLADSLSVSNDELESKKRLATKDFQTSQEQLSDAPLHSVDVRSGDDLELSDAMLSDLMGVSEEEKKRREKRREFFESDELGLLELL